MQLIEAAGGAGRHRQRDATLILLMFRHGLRVSEAVALQWADVELEKGLLHVRRGNKAVSSTHRLVDAETRALSALRDGHANTAYVFTSERKAPLSTAAVRKIVARAGAMAGIPFPVHPYQLRHATAYVLTQTGTDIHTLRRYLGHK